MQLSEKTISKLCTIHSGQLTLAKQAIKKGKQKIRTGLCIVGVTFSKNRERLFDMQLVFNEYGFRATLCFHENITVTGSLIFN